MISTPSIPLDLSVDQLFKRWPQVAPVFLRYRMACLGCSLAMFDTLRDVAWNYGLEPEPFLQELERAIAAPLAREDSQLP